MKSILQTNKRVCFLCSILHGDDHEQFTHCHHVMYGTSGRKLSEKYGLKIYLCPNHHEFTPEAVHKNKDINRMLRRAAQVVFITKHSYEKWMEVFGMNYLEEEELKIRADSAEKALYELNKPKKADAFEIIDDPVPYDLPF